MSICWAFARKTLFTSTTLVLLSMAAFSGTARVADDALVVGKPGTRCPDARYSTITDAINAAPSGATINICPALYPEHVTIDKPLTLRGVSENGVNRVLLQPVPPFDAVITVRNTHDVTIRNLTIDASNNTVSACAVLVNTVITGGLAGIHFYNSSGSVESNAIFGARLKHAGCTAGAGRQPVLFPGNGYGVLVDTDNTASGPFRVSISDNRIHDFTRNGILVIGSQANAEIVGNVISGDGPSTGGNQFGVFLALGAVGKVRGNAINEGNCGTLSALDCFDRRSEGVVLRAAGDGTVVEGNIITNAQSGIFVNGANAARITNNVIMNIDVLSGIHIQALTNSQIDGNKIFGVGPINEDASTLQTGCGINELSGPAISGNTLRNNIVNDAYCGVAYVTADQVHSGTYFNTLYTTFNSDEYPTAYPPAIEP
jgi:Right handed beta helix region